MSTIYVFSKTEATISASSSSTGTTGASMVSSDSLLIYNSVPNTTNQVTVGSVSGLTKLENISTNTSSSLTSFPTLSPYGISVIGATGTANSSGLVAYLPAPPQAGLYKTIVAGTGTSTGLQVVCPSTTSTILSSGASSGVYTGNESIFFGQMAAYVDLVSLSTSTWLIVGRSVGGLSFTTTTTT